MYTTDDLERVAMQLIHREFLFQIEPVTKVKLKIINSNPMPFVFILNKDNGKIVMSDMKYPPEVQALLDKCDKLIDSIRVSLQKESTVKNYMLEARRILDKRSHKIDFYYA